MTATLKTTIIQEPSSSTANITLDGSGNAAVIGNITGANLTLTGIGPGRLIRGPQYLTSGTSYTTPVGCTRILVEAWGGGGGGASNSGSTYAGGGGSGCYATKMFVVSENTSYSYSIGSGGNGGSGAASNGSNGGNTTFGPVDGVTLTAGGGTGGIATGAAGTGGTATNADSSLSNDGFAGNAAIPNACSGGDAPFWGANNGTGLAALGNGGGFSATRYGGGGGGSRGISTGGAGFQGIIKITEFY